MNNKIVSYIMLVSESSIHGEADNTDKQGAKK